MIDSSMALDCLRNAYGDPGDKDGESAFLPVLRHDQGAVACAKTTTAPLRIQNPPLETAFRLEFDRKHHKN